MNHRAHPRVGAGTQRASAAATGNLVSRRPGHPKLVSQVARAVGAGLGRLLAQLDDFVREPVDELLLLVNGQVQLIQQVFGEAGLDFQCFKPLKDFVGKG